MIKVYSMKDFEASQEKSYCSISLAISPSGDYKFTLEINNRISFVTFSKTSDLSDRLRSWMQDLENKYNLIRLF